MSLVIVGSVGLDTIETPAGKVTEALGGSAVYGALAASYFTQPYIVGVVGSDFPQEHIQLLKKHEINLDGLEIREGKTFRWKSRYYNWNHAITLETQLNVFGDFQPVLPKECRRCRAILLGNIHPDLQLAVLQQIKNHDFVACDTMNFWITGARKALEEVIRRVEIVFINEEELKLYTGNGSIYKGAKEILALGPKLVVVKRGEYGSVLIGSDLLFFAPAYPVSEVKDPTGAGDSFAGGFMGYLARVGRLNPQSLKEAALYGAVMAALNVRNFSVYDLLNHDLNDIKAKHAQLVKWISLQNDS